MSTVWRIGNIARRTGGPWSATVQCLHAHVRERDREPASAWFGSAEALCDVARRLAELADGSVGHAETPS